MAKYDDYHTALAGELDYKRTCTSAHFQRGRVFQYDIFSRSPPREFNSCDVFYADLPWRSGFAEFEGRAGASGRRYGDFLEAVKWHVELFSKPTILVTGKHAIKALDPHEVIETKLNGDPAMALCWNVCLPISGNEHQILATIAEEYAHGGDLCCGYGRTAKAFKDAGKWFTVSDYNPRCVAYVADKLGGVRC